MKYIRVLIKNEKPNEIISENFKWICEYQYTDYFYDTKDKKLDSNSTLKIRDYKKNSWDCKKVLVIEKNSQETDKKSKIEEIIDKIEFDTLEEAKDYVAKKYRNYNFLFELSRTGQQYSNEDTIVWVEKLQYLGWSVEIGYTFEAAMDSIINMLDVKDVINEPLANFVYKYFTC